MPRNNTSGLGGKLGPAVARLMVESTVAARARLAPHEARVHQAAQKALIDMKGEEVADMVRPLFAHALAHPDTHPVIREFLQKGASGHHQFQAELLGGITQQLGYGLLGSVLDNLIAPVVYPINAVNRNTHVDPGTAAQAAAHGWATEAEARRTMEGFGYTDSAINVTQALAYTYPAPSEINEMLNRGTITAEEAKLYLERNGLVRNLTSQMLDLRNTEIDPPDLALAILRGNLTTAEGYKLAARVGTSRSQLDLLIANTGEPPSVTDLALGLRRGIISDTEFTKGIRQSRVRDEWIPFLKQVQFSPMSVADAITAYVQGHLTEAQAKAIAHINGLRPEDFLPLYESAGEPISKTEVYELLRRKKITTAQATQAIKESRIKDKYIPDILALTEQLPPAREVATLYSHGALTKVQAETILSESGYSPEVQKAFIDSAIHGKVASLKNVTLGQVSRLYVENVISWAEGEKLLAKTGYQPAELTYVKEILDNQRLFRNREVAINKIRSLYVSYHVDQTTASGQLDALQVQASERDRLLAYWSIARESNAKMLTKAEILDAAQIGFITWQDADAMLQIEGYSAEYSALLIGIKAKGSVAGIISVLPQGGTS